jgi:DNA-binding transcriptional LysR family regulator
MSLSAVARWRTRLWWRARLDKRAGWLATPTYFTKHGEPKSPAELIAHQTVIYTPDGGGLSWTFRQGSTETSVAGSGRLEVTAAEGLREAVFAHLGIAITSEWNFAPEVGVRHRQSSSE